MKRILAVAFVLFAHLPAWTAERPPSASAPAASRPASWARRIELAGAPNLHKVSDTVYRSGQPTAAGMRNLQAMGIRTIVNLRSFHSDRDEIGTATLVYERIYMKAWHPEVEEIIRFLRIVTDPKRAPVLVHCEHGADRTGTMCAVYRICVQGWTKEEAIKEMKQGGYGFHSVWIELAPWIRGLDIDKIRKKAGIQKGFEESAAGGSCKDPAPEGTPQARGSQ